MVKNIVAYLKYHYALTMDQRHVKAEIFKLLDSLPEGATKQQIAERIHAITYRELAYTPRELGTMAYATARRAEEGNLTEAKARVNALIEDTGRTQFGWFLYNIATGTGQWLIWVLPKLFVVVAGILLADHIRANL